MLSQGELCDAAINFNTYLILQRHRTWCFPATVRLSWWSLSADCLLVELRKKPQALLMGLQLHKKYATLFYCGKKSCIAFHYRMLENDLRHSITKYIGKVTGHASLSNSVSNQCIKYFTLTSYPEFNMKWLFRVIQGHAFGNAFSFCEKPAKGCISCIYRVWL